MLETEIKKLTAALEAHTKALEANTEALAKAAHPPVILNPAEASTTPAAEEEQAEAEATEPEKAEADDKLSSAPDEDEDIFGEQKTIEDVIPTIEQVKEALTDAMGKIGKDKAVKIMIDIGKADKLSEVPKDNYRAVIDACKKAKKDG